MTDFLRRNRQSVSWAIMAIAIALVAGWLPQGFDYRMVFVPHLVPVFFVPWTDGLLYLLPWPVLVSITIMSLVIAIQRNGGSKWLIIPAVFSLPTIWVLLLGALEGVTLAGLLVLRYALPVRLVETFAARDRRWWLALVVLGAATVVGAAIIGTLQGPHYNFTNSTTLGQQPLIGLAMILLLPWAMPLILLRPQLAAFALLARRSWFVAGALWMVLSVIIWGWWLPNLLLKVTPELKAAQPQNVSLFPWSIVFVLPMLWLSRRDPDMLMAAGSLIAPSVIPYYYLVLIPSLARLPLKYAMVCWLSSFLPLTANYFGPAWWLTGNVFPLMIWSGLWHTRTSADKPPAAMWQAA
ncbi:MAG: hypothetical protein HY870_18240 [Chloroflexi bacterium]|nr:hypothetical protein [Chloroflexota bacterium]